MLAYDLFLFALRRCLTAHLLEIGMLLDVLGSHAIQNKVGLIGHAHNVVLAGVRQQSALVDQLNERQARMLLQRCLPLLRAQQHDELDHRAGLSQGGQARGDELLAVRAHYNFGQQLRELDQYVFEEGRDGHKRLLKLVGDAHVVRFYDRVQVTFGIVGQLVNGRCSRTIHLFCLVVNFNA